jgi:UDP-N-acetylmuramate dehydrogenase
MSVVISAGRGREKTMDALIERRRAITTWFKIGGAADLYARPVDAAHLGRLVQSHPDVRVLGDGANLLIDDDGAPGLVVELTEPAWTGMEMDATTGKVMVGAGVKLPQLIHQTVRAGLGGLEVLGGIPATIGGALVMNAGGAFGQIADLVESVRGVTREGRTVERLRGDIPFGYRTSGLDDLIVTGATLRLTPGDSAVLRRRLLEIMEYKKNSQPMAANSAGCAFKNPTLTADLNGIGVAGQRVSAGMLIDKAGLKGLVVGGAEVSRVHANFIVTHPVASASNVIALMGEVVRRVRDRFGVELKREVVVWSKHDVPG